MSDGDVSRMTYEAFPAFSSVYQALVNYGGVNQKLMGKSMCVSGAVKHTLVRGVTREAGSPGAFTPDE